MSRIFIVYSTTDGHTVKICSRLKALLEEENHEVESVPVESAGGEALEAADKVVIGASIRYGKHSKKIHEFVGRYAAVLERRPNAFFSVNVVARKPNRNTPQTNPYLRRFLTQIAWEPMHLAVFAGKIDYPSYGVFDRSMIRMIMWITKGPTDPKAQIEFTDWDKVREFGDLISKM